VVATTRLPLHDFKRVKSAFACSLNDVVLAVAAGGLRRFAHRQGQLPAEPLICSVPTSTDPGGGPPRLWGNRVSQFFTSLCTDIDNPEQRLRAISSVTKNAKLLNAELGPELMEQWNEFAGPMPYRLLWGQIMRRVKTPAVNVVVSTVPGPRDDVWFGRSRIKEFYSLSVLTEGAGLNLTVWSYRDGMYLGVVSCPELAGDVEAMVDDLREALGELVKLAEA
jgi:WS/DGAT/MGAT family acyltransferase